MSSKRIALLLPLTPLLLATAPAPLPHVTVPPIDVSLMKDTVKELASDALEGRGPSTRAEPKVLDAIVRRFKAAGLKPGMPDGTWLQEVPTVEITGSKHSPLVVSGGKEPLSFQFGSDFVAGSYRVVPHTEIAPSELVFVGYGVNTPELG